MFKPFSNHCQTIFLPHNLDICAVQQFLPALCRTLSRCLWSFEVASKAHPPGCQRAQRVNSDIVITMVIIIHHLSSSPTTMYYHHHEPGNVIHGRRTAWTHGFGQETNQILAQRTLAWRPYQAYTIRTLQQEIKTYREWDNYAKKTNCKNNAISRHVYCWIWNDMDTSTSSKQCYVHTHLLNPMVLLLPWHGEEVDWVQLHVSSKYN